jgi:PQQ-dependent catabolism-associated CXXCW motif protein
VTSVGGRGPVRLAVTAQVALAAMLLVSATARADPNVPVPDGYRQDDYRAPVPDSLPGGEVLHLPAMRDLVARGGAVLIDVLPAPRRPDAMRPGTPWLPQPHRSLPGALWWPEVGRGALPPGAEARFAERLRATMGGDTGRLVVFFCLNDCWMSWNAARRAASLGVRAGWFPEGVDGWEAAGLPIQPVQADE